MAPVWHIAQNGIRRISRDIEAENEAKAIFGEATYSFNHQWSLTLGARQSWDDRAMTTFQQSLAGECQVQGEDGQFLPDDACARKVEESFSKPTWRVSANYQPGADHLVYGSVSTGYRAGGFNARGTDNFTLRPFDEETVTTYEFGHKGDWQLAGMAVRSNLAVFLQDYEDIQKTQDRIVDGVYGTTIVNAAKAEIKGAELDVTLAPNDYLTLSLAYSYIDAGYEEWDLHTPVGTDDQGNVVVESVDNSDAPFNYIPEQSLTGSLEVLLPLDPALGDASLTTSVYWQDEMYSTYEQDLWPDQGWSQEDLEEANNTAVLDDYAVWNLRLDWRRVMGSQFDIAAYANNVTDEQYVLGGISVPEQLGLISETYGPPRTYGMSLR